MREEKRWNLVTGPPRFVAVLFEPPIRDLESAGLLAGGKIGGKRVKKRKKGKKKGKNFEVAHRGIRETRFLVQKSPR